MPLQVNTLAHRVSSWTVSFYPSLKKAEKEARIIEVVTKNNPEMTPMIMINAAGKLRK
jgi:hypothetical protein